MRVTITGRLVNNRVNEGSACTFTANFFDDSSTSTDVWSASTPTTAKYRIDQLYGEPGCWREVLGWTSLTPATSISIPVTAAQNAIQNTYCREERRQITVKANDGLSTQYEASHLYRVINLAGSP